MTSKIGKRKRRIVEATKNDAIDDAGFPESFNEAAQEVFRRHFEARFKPLPKVQKLIEAVAQAPDDVSEEGSEWGGISDEEGSSVPIIEHTDARAQMATMSKAQLKAFMSSKPLSSSPAILTVRDEIGAAIEDDDASEAANLKKDLALQRLLTESHLLDSAANPTLSGNNRHKATDLRLQALGSKVSILKQEKMPMAHRRGIIAKQTQKEDMRRKDAKENGIILEKAKLGKKPSERKRDRGVGAPGIGRFTNGTLKLSKKDIFDMEGPKRGSSSRGERGGSRGRGRGHRGK